jgi:ligand-binding sensor domain-containing protein
MSSFAARFRPAVPLLVGAGLLSAAEPCRADWFYLEGSGGLGITWSSTIGPDGNIWFAADTGIAHYDGLTLRRHFPGHYPDPFYDVRSLVFDRDGRLWGGTQGGVARLDSLNALAWIRFPRGAGIPDGIVHAMAMDSSGAIWAGTEAGLARFDGVSWSPDTGPVGSSRVNELLCDRNGVLWVGTAVGLFRLAASGWLPALAGGDSLFSSDVHALLEDSRGRVWAGTAGGPSVFADGAWTRIPVPGDRDAGILSLGEDTRGGIWLGTGTMVHRYDGLTWTTMTVADGLPDPTVYSIVRDSEGAMWFGTRYGSAARFDGKTWRVHRPEPGGLPDRFANALSRDRAGRIWVGTGSGAASWDGSRWTPVTVASTNGGLASNQVWMVLEDSSGDHWFSTLGSRVSRRRQDGTWVNYRDSTRIFASAQVRNIYEDPQGAVWFCTEDGAVAFRRDPERWQAVAELAGITVGDVMQDRRGDLWFATHHGVFQLGPAGWIRHLQGTVATSLLEDREGRIWTGTWGGLHVFDGAAFVRRPYQGLRDAELVDRVREDRLGYLWIATAGGAHRLGSLADGSYSMSDGLGDDRATDVLVDVDGTLWFTNTAGVVHHGPDYVAPRPFFSPHPPAAHGSDELIVSHAGGFLETGHSFSHALDGGDWSPWTGETQSLLTNLHEGLNEVRLRSRDRIGNVSTFPTSAWVEVDSDPPLPAITYPANGQIVRGMVPIRGSASDERFRSYTVEIRPLGDAAREDTSIVPIAAASRAARDTLLGAFDSVLLRDGQYEVRVTMEDTLGLRGRVFSNLVIDNQMPDAAQTAPLVLNGARGGTVYSTRGEVRLDFPPGTADSVVSVDIVVDGPATSSLPPLPGGARSRPFVLDWSPAALRRTPALRVRCEPGLAGSGTTPRPTLHRWAGRWEPVGGTWDPVAESVEVLLQSPGTYVVGNEAAAAPPEGGLGDVTLSPRVFTPRPGGGAGEVAIAFSLGAATEAEIRIHNRAGRLVRLLRPETPLQAGRNLVRWDGRDEQANWAEDGLYLVTVRALGQTRTQALVVAR